MKPLQIRRCNHRRLFRKTGWVDVIGTSKGKGFKVLLNVMGLVVWVSLLTVKHNRFVHQVVGACSYPAKVFKRNAYGWSNGWRSCNCSKLAVIKVIPEHNLFLLKDLYQEQKVQS